jgi:uncharacterized protein YbaP (TraB family)
MKDLNIELFKKLITSETQRVKDPLIFKVTTPYGTFDLLGTVHVMSLSVLPKRFLMSLPRYDQIIMETRLKPNADDIAQAPLVYQGLLRNAEADWFNQLTPEQQDFINNLWKEAVKNLNSKCGWHLSEEICLKDYKYGFINNMLVTIICSLCIPSLQQKGIKMIEGNDSMDQEIIKLFFYKESPTYVLESMPEEIRYMYGESMPFDIGYFTILLDVYRQLSSNPGPTITQISSELRRIYTDSQQQGLVEKLDTLESTLKAALEMSDNNMLEESYLLDDDNLSLETAKEVDEYLESANPSTITRNNLWLPRIIEFSKLPGQKLICCGTLHLLGKNGLLFKFAELRFTVQKMAPDGKFYPFNYAESIQQEMIASSLELQRLDYHLSSQYFLPRYSHFKITTVDSYSATTSSDVQQKQLIVFSKQKSLIRAFTP